MLTTITKFGQAAAAVGRCDTDHQSIGPMDDWALPSRQNNGDSTLNADIDSTLKIHCICELNQH